MSSAPDTEITLGTGKLLLLFFGLVALCAVFFGMGYSLGRSSGRPGIAEAAAPPPGTPVTRANAHRPNESGKQSDLTFYKAVEQKDADSTLTPAAQTNTAPAENGDANANKAPSAPDPAAIASGSSYFVQVAAVSKQEDAEALVEALKKKQYPAFTANGSGTDRLYHVQVGPYGDIKDAESMRGKLIGDGYNPILKK